MGGGAPTPSSSGERYGVAQDALSLLGNEVNVSNVASGDTKEPRIAWIRMPNQSGGQTAGRGLIGFTRNTIVGWRASWAYSTDWSVAGTPSWPTFASNSSVPGVKWPAPDNLCQRYPGAFECDGSGNGWNSAAMGSSVTGRYNQVAAALYPGLNAVGALVTTAGLDSNDEDVAIAVSIDGGQTFAHSLILSMNAADGTDSGDFIYPESVHASVASFGEVSSPRNGDLSLPIYVTWMSQVPFGGGRQWWWTRVVVGVSGTVAEAMLPQRLNMIPAQPGSHASIFGWRLDGIEHVGVAWSDRSDAAAPPTCPSTLTADTKWWVSQTNDFGDSWTCFKGGYSDCVNAPIPGSDANKTAIARDTSWKTCVGPNQLSRQSRNNDRPEVAIHAPAVAALNGIDEDDIEKRFRFAVTQRASGSGSNMRVCVYGHDPFSLGEAWDSIEQKFCSNNTNPDGQAVQDAWGHSMVFMHSAASAHLFTVLLRESAQTTGNPIKMIAMQSAEGGSKTEANVSSQSFGYETDWGLGTGVATYQRCDPGIAGCPSGSSFIYPAVGTLAVWPDTRVTTTTRTDIFTRSFLW